MHVACAARSHELHGCALPPRVRRTARGELPRRAAAPRLPRVPAGLRARLEREAGARRANAALDEPRGHP